uniref:Lysophospholipid acyltransferase 7 n=1 Tax=Rhabditophanes sp. KR3021 TaxID=114890 RepID=A0AC35TP48_9BILA
MDGISKKVIHHAGFTPLEFLINVVQLILTLRVVGLSYEIEDSIQNGGNTNEKTRFVKVPNTLEAFNYLYNFIGLFTGPYYTYQIYSDTLESTAIYDVDITEFISERVLTISWSLPSLLIVYGLAPLEFLRSEAVSSTNFIVLMFWVCIAFYYLRLRIYTAWMIAECICITSGIGVYPASCNNVPSGGPQNIEAYNKLKNKLNIKYDAVTISNLDIPNVEMSTGFRNGMRAWNRSVQYWLATFVYKRSPKSIRMPYTMFISAFWHGLHIGYFLSFMTIPLCTAAEDLIYKVVPIDKQTGERPKWFQFIWLNIRTRSFELMASGFLLLTWTDTARLWNAMYWYIHIVMISIIVGSKLIIESREKSDNDKMKVN